MPGFPFSRQAALLVVACVFFGSALGRNSAQAEKNYAALSNPQCLEMLNQVESDIKQYYYDPALRGFDLDKRFETARHEIAASKSQDESLLSIYAAVAAFSDSHTRFIPPIRPYAVDYGFLLQAIGDSDCYVVAVKPGSDAEMKGLKAGDQLLALNGIKYTRADLRVAIDAYERIVPQSGLRLDVRSIDGKEKSVLISGKVERGQAVVRGVDFREFLRHYHLRNRSRYFSIGKRVLVWKLPDFVFDPREIREVFGKARSFDSLVLDLRGNPGGSQPTMDVFIGHLFDHDVKLFDKKGRKGLETETARSAGNRAFSGKLVVLIDSRSGSASEILARVVQLEKRGILIGDRSAGGVAEGMQYMHAVKLDATNVTQYGTSVTIGEVLMSDGKNLENVGVTPDERVLPTPSDLSSGNDPALARAIQLAGRNVSPADAGKIFPFHWPEKLTVEFN